MFRLIRQRTYEPVHLASLRDHEIDKFLALEPARPIIVAFPLDHVERHHSAELPIPLRQFAGVLFDRRHGVLAGNIPFTFLVFPSGS